MNNQRTTTSMAAERQGRIGEERMPEEAPDDKHRDLYSAIESLTSVQNRLEALEHRISGPQPETNADKCVSESPPTLVALLDGGGHDIRQRRDIMASTIERIETLLFGG